MKKNRTIQIKAGFLLLVFAFNIVVGFACGLGIDMGFNSNSSKSSHHTGKVHVHADGKKHQHETATHNNVSKKHHDDNDHHHEKGGCCTDGVVKLAQTEKAVPQAIVLMNPLFATAFIATFYPTNIFYKSQVTEPIKYFVRGHHPPIPDIRVAIQSFQI